MTIDVPGFSPDVIERIIRHLPHIVRHSGDSVSAAGGRRWLTSKIGFQGNFTNVHAHEKWVSLVDAVGVWWFFFKDELVAIEFKLRFG